MATSGFLPTSMEAIPKIVAEARAGFDSGKTRPLAWRRQQLERLIALLDEKRDVLNRAVYADLRKSPEEFYMAEILMARNDAVEAIENLHKWTAPVYPSVTPPSMLDDNRIIQDPLGVVLIIGAWNYPLQLTLVPLVGAIAAGNAAILKPSEVSPQSAKVIADLVAQYLDPQCIRVVNGAVAETTLLLEQRFDHILYTGNSNVGKIIMAAAARNLTPVTLELGGKSPCIVDSNSDLAIVGRRVAWGRFVNCGQTCIAPDYVLALPGVEDKLVHAIQTALKEYFTENPQKSPNYGRIVNRSHFNRLAKLISGQVVGGRTDEADLYIEPTILKGCTGDSPAMKDEIFGPILPIVTVNSIADAIKFINKREKPLALYVFSNNAATCQAVADQTSSGGFIANDTLMHAAEPNLPFGGVGYSGIGAYHGKLTFDVFTHRKAAIFKKQNLEFINNVRYPPYSASKTGQLNFAAARSGPSSFHVPWKRVFIVVLLALVAARLRTTNPNFISGVQAFLGL